MAGDNEEAEGEEEKMAKNMRYVVCPYCKRTTRLYRRFYFSMRVQRFIVGWKAGRLEISSALSTLLTSKYDGEIRCGMCWRELRKDQINKLIAPRGRGTAGRASRSNF